MRFSLKTPKGIWTLASLPIVMSATMIAGCDSAYGPAADSAEAKAQVQARQGAIKAEEDKANALLKKRGGKDVPELRSIKGNIKLPESK